MMLDAQLKRVVYRNPAMLVPWFLMCGYAYEIRDKPLISDGAWDWLCEQLRKNWSTIKHRHKLIIDRRSLNTATAGYLTVDDYPSIAVGAADDLIKEMERGTNEYKEHERQLKREHRRLRQRRRRVS